MKIRYQWSRFDELSPIELYRILRLRQEVFVVEQSCPYLDCDNLDQTALHCIGWTGKDAEIDVAAYLRLIPPGSQKSSIAHAPLTESPSHSAFVSMGRVVTAPAARGYGFGKEIVQQAIFRCETEFPGLTIRVAAQRYLLQFYQSFGFSQTGEEYKEDGIDHVDMIKFRG